MMFPESSVKQNTGNLIDGHHRFAHNAMNTRFEILIAEREKSYAAQAAAEAFHRLDELESALSRFLPNSDISRIHAAPAGKSVRVGLDAFACLKSCREIWEKTGGLFDITIGTLFGLWRETDHPASARELREARKRTGMNLLILDETNFTATSKVDHLDLDLGGFGKGYAVDRMAESLREWDIGSALIHGGASSALAFGNVSWPVSYTNPWTGKGLGILQVDNSALGASGLQKGRHIVHPKTAAPVTEDKAAWVMAGNAALADALSTAVMMVPHGEMGAILKNFEEIKAFVLWKEGDQKETFGDWPDYNIRNKNGAGGCVPIACPELVEGPIAHSRLPN